MSWSCWPIVFMAKEYILKVKLFAVNLINHEMIRRKLLKQSS